MDRQRQRLPPKRASRAPGYRRGIFSQGVEYSVRSLQKGASSGRMRPRAEGRSLHPMQHPISGATGPSPRTLWPITLAGRSRQPRARKA